MAAIQDKGIKVNALAKKLRDSNEEGILGSKRTYESAVEVEAGELLGCGCRSWDNSADLCGCHCE